MRPRLRLPEHFRGLLERWLLPPVPSLDSNSVLLRPLARFPDSPSRPLVPRQRLLRYTGLRSALLRRRPAQLAPRHQTIRRRQLPLPARLQSRRHPDGPRSPVGRVTVFYRSLWTRGYVELQL